MLSPIRRIIEGNRKKLRSGRKIEKKNVRDKNLTQQVLDTKKSNQKLKNIVNNLQEEEYITPEIAQILKVN